MSGVQLRSLRRQYKRLVKARRYLAAANLRKRIAKALAA